MALIKIQPYVIDETQSFVFNNVTATGNLVSSNANLGNLVIGNNFQGNGSLLSSITGGNVLGQVSNALVSGTVYSNAQPNITSVGTLATLSVTGNVDAAYFVGNGAFLTGVVTGTSYSNANVAAYLPTYTGVITGSSITLTGNIVSGNAALGNLATSNYFSGNGSLLSGITGANITGTVANANYAAFAGTVTTAAQPNITSTGILTSLSVTGNVNSGYFVGNGAFLTGLPAGYSNANVAAYLPTYTGNVSASYFIGNGSLLTGVPAGNVTGTVANANYALYAGTVITGSQPNITSHGTLVSLSVSGNANIGNIGTAIVTATGNITGSNIIGNGAYLTGINASNITGTVANANYAAYAGNVTLASQPNITSVGILSSLSVTGNIDASANINSSGNLYITGNIVSGSGDGGEITGANLVSANYLVGTLLTAAQPNITSVGTLTTLSATGNVTGSNIVGNGAYLTSITGGNVTGQVANALVAGTVYTNAQPNITSTGILSSLSVSGAATTGNLNTTNAVISGNLTVGGTTTYINVSTTAIVDPIIELGGGANGAALASDDNKDRGTLLHYYSAGAPINAFMGWDDSNVEFAFGSNVSVSSEVVTFNEYGNLRANYFIGTLSGTAATATTATTAGTVTTNAQPNITSTGTLVSVSVSGNANIGNIGTGIITATGNITGSNIIGDGSYLSNITGANVTGTVANANYATFAGTVITSAQPNITSVGTLVSLSVSGNAQIGNLNSIDSLTLDTANAPGIVNVGQLSWNDGDGTLDVGLKGGVTTLQVGLETLARVYNDSGVGLVDGDVVYISGAQGNRIAVKKALANSESTSYGTLGMVTEPISSGAEGFITVVGSVHGLDTTGLTAGDMIFLSPTTAGAYTTTKPTAPDHTVILGYVERVHATQGSLYIKVDNGYELDELHNVVISTATAGQSLVYNGNVWVNGVANVANYAGVVTSASQPNITSTGILASLSVTGNVDAGYFVGNGAFLTGLPASYSNTNVAAYLPTYTGNVSAGYFIGDGSLLTNITGANVTGTVANATSATSATTAGTVTANAQPNITSVGTLSGLVSTGTINFTGASNVSLGSISNVFIGGGTSGYVLSTDGAGVLSWVAQSNGGGGGGSPGGANSHIQFNDEGVFGGSSSLTFNKGTNTLSATYITGTLTTAAQPNITSTGTLASLSVTGNVNAGYYVGNGAFLTGLPAGYANADVAAYLPTYTGNVSASYFIGDGSLLTNITGANVTGTVSSATTAGTVTAAAQSNITSTGTLSSLSVSGNANIGNIGTSIITATGNITGGNISGTLLTGTIATAAQPNITSVGILSGASVSGNLDITGNVNVTGNLNYNNVTNLEIGDPLIYIGSNNTGNLYDLGIVASYNDGTYVHSGLVRNHTNGVWTIFDGVIAEPTTVIDWANSTAGAFRAGNIFTTNATLGNLAISNYFQGNGSYLSSITGGNVTGQVANALVAGTVYTNAQPNITSTGTLSSLSVSGNANIGNIGTAGVIVSSIASGTAPMTVASTTRVANLNVAYANVSDYTAVTEQTTGNFYPVFVSANASGNYSIGATSRLTVNAATGTLSIGTGGGGNITGANLVSANYFQGNGSLITYINGANVIGNVPYTTTANYANFAGTVITAAQPNITSTGTLASLSVSGNANIGNIGTAIITATGNITGGNISGTLLTGTITTAAQPNITSHGTLVSLSVSGNANIGNIGTAIITATGNITGGNISGTLLTGTITTAAQPNITSHGVLVSLSVSGNANIGNIGTGIITATGNITGGNISGTLLTGTITTAAQPNITSHGTLVSLSVSGNANIGNIGTAGIVSATGNITGNNLAGTLVTGTITTAAQPNITSVGTLSGIVSTGTVNFNTTSNITLGNVSNIHISGGSNGYVLSTDGFGGLSWSSSAGGGTSATITDDTSTDTTYYPVYATSSSGSMSVAGITTTKLQFNPSSGQLTVQDLNTLSDATLKEDAYVIDDPFTVLNQLSGMGFTWSETKKKSYGLLAQLLEPVLPELVNINAQGKKTVNYIPIIAFLIEAVKKQQAEIESLKKDK